MSMVLSLFSAHLGKGRSRRSGQTLVEYSLILAVISIVLISVFALLSKQIVVVFSAITTILDTAQAGSH